MQRTGLAVVLIGSVFLAGWASRTGESDGVGERAAAAMPAAPLDLGLVPIYRAGAQAIAPARDGAAVVAASGWDAPRR